VSNPSAPWNDQHNCEAGRRLGAPEQTEAFRTWLRPCTNPGTEELVVDDIPGREGKEVTFLLCLNHLEEMIGPAGCLPRDHARYSTSADAAPVDQAWVDATVERQADGNATRQRMTTAISALSTHRRRLLPHPGQSSFVVHLDGRQSLS
jgi:hypothetical protein